MPRWEIYSPVIFASELTLPGTFSLFVSIVTTAAWVCSASVFANTYWSQVAELGRIESAGWDIEPCRVQSDADVDGMETVGPVPVKLTLRDDKLAEAYFFRRREINGMSLPPGLPPDLPEGELRLSDVVEKAGFSCLTHDNIDFYLLPPRDYRRVKNSALCLSIILGLGVVILICCIGWAVISVLRHRRYLVVMGISRASPVGESGLASRPRPCCLRSMPPPSKVIDQILDDGAVDPEKGPEDASGEHEAMCVICLESLAPGAYPAGSETSCVRLMCRHHFHRDCVKQWLSMSAGTCPICMARVV